eukprot:2671943-Amphidinium_carterae.1
MASPFSMSAARTGRAVATATIIPKAAPTASGVHAALDSSALDSKKGCADVCTAGASFTVAWPVGAKKH